MGKTKYECIQCNYITKNKYDFDKHCKTKKHNENKTILKYKEGKIYSIRSKNTDKFYIGSTCRDISIRLKEHRCKFRSYIKGNYEYLTSYDILKFQDSYIELIENYPCNSKKELLLRESYHIQNTKKCVNKIIVTYSKNFICEYCNCERVTSQRARHYSKCKSKKDHDVNSEIKELRELTTHLKEELVNSEKRMFEFIKTIASTNNSTITNNTNTTNNNNNINNNNYNMYYIINNFTQRVITNKSLPTEAENIEDVMKIPFTQEELEYIEKNGSILGSYNLIKGRCVEDKDLSKRPVHCSKT
jgi:hypothetical protein